MSQISDKNMTESKGFCTGRRKKNPRTNSRDSNARNSPLSDITSGQPPRGRRALLCCVSYKDQKFELKGTSLDLKNMMDLLEKQLGFLRSSILILAEKEQYKKPTRKNIEAAFDWLMRGIQPGDSLLFYFSGHGLRQRGINGDEVDGYDECICPMDFETNGYILDNYIKKKIVEPLVTGVKLHAIIDSCHSGTVLDLPHVYNMSTGQWEAHHTSNNEYKGTSGGKAICISACEDYQLAADTSDLSPDNEMSGAMTWTFIKAVKSNKNITYRGMLEQMHMYLKRENKVGCVSAGLRRVFRRKILQNIFRILCFHLPTSSTPTLSSLSDYPEMDAADWEIPEPASLTEEEKGLPCMQECVGWHTFCLLASNSMLIIILRIRPLSKHWFYCLYKRIIWFFSREKENSEQHINK